MSFFNNKSAGIGIIFIILAAFTRMLTFLPNFSVMESLALFGGAYFASRYLAILIPIIVLYISDFVINNTIARSFFPDHEGLVFFSEYMVWNFIAMALIAVIGSKFLKKISFGRVLGGILGATAVFFLLTNFGSWASDIYSIYPKTFGGLMSSFVAGLPFLKNSLLGNLTFGIILFGSYECVKYLMASRIKAKNSAL